MGRTRPKLYKPFLASPNVGRKTSVAEVPQTGNTASQESDQKPESLKISIEDRIRETFGADADTAIAVARAESHLNPRATHVNNNGTVDEGVFMINSSHHQADMLDPDKNIAYAYELYKSSNWNPWVVFQTGAYKKFL